MTTLRQVSIPVGEASIKILEAAGSSDHPLEHTLAKLESYGIECHATAEGALLARFWQVAAEDFVPIERIAEIRQDRIIPDDAAALDWVSANLERLTREHAGNWIAVSNNAAVAASTTLQELLSLIEMRGIQNPFITRVPEEPIIWETAYDNQDL